MFVMSRNAVICGLGIERSLEDNEACSRARCLFAVETDTNGERREQRGCLYILNLSTATSWSSVIPEFHIHVRLTDSYHGGDAATVWPELTM